MNIKFEDQSSVDSLDDEVIIEDNHGAGGRQPNLANVLEGQKQEPAEITKQKMRLSQQQPSRVNLSIQDTNLLSREDCSMVNSKRTKTTKRPSKYAETTSTRRHDEIPAATNDKDPMMNQPPQPKPMDESKTKSMDRYSTSLAMNNQSQLEKAHNDKYNS